MTGQYALYFLPLLLICILYLLDPNLLLGLYYELALLGIKLRRIPIRIKFFIQFQIDRYRMKKLIKEFTKHK